MIFESKIPIHIQGERMWELCKYCKLIEECIRWLHIKQKSKSISKIGEMSFYNLRYMISRNPE